MDDRSLFADQRALVLVHDPLVRDRLSAHLHVLGFAVQGSSAVDAAWLDFEGARPDLILLQRDLAGDDGLELVRMVRREDPAHWIPILMIGRDRSGPWEAEALEGGCDDYLSDYFVDEVLTAKLTSLLRMRRLRRFSELQRAELSAFRDRAEGEADLARFLLSRLSRVEHLDGAGVAYHWLPAEGFSGDLLAATRSSSGDLYGLLADATGHGLAAAINLIPLTTAFYAMAAKGFNLQAIAEQLNKVVKDYSLPDRFVAVTLARFAAREQRLEVVNAGNPSALLLDRQHRVVREIHSVSIPLGILDRPLFKPKIEVCELTGDEDLLMYSDGLVESTDFDGTPFGREGIVRARELASSQRCGIVEALRRALSAHCIGVSPADDVSLLVLSAPQPSGTIDVWPDAVAAQAAEEKPLPELAIDVQGTPKRCVVEVSFSSIELQRVDVVPVIVGLTRSIGMTKNLESRFFTVLSELYVNALDHGLLALDSSIKDAPDGFERYFSERSRRLNALDDGAITIRLEHRYDRKGGGTMRIEVSDSGPGFDHQRFMRGLVDPTLQESEGQRAGRGLSLLMTLCDEVEFNEAGNRVNVAFSYS